MQVTHLVPSLFGGADGIVGGAERYAYELARHMSRAVPTRLVTFGDSDREESVDGLRIRVYGRSHHVRGQRTNPFSLRALRDLAREEVVHCHQQHVVMSSLTALARKLCGRRVFVSDLGGGGWDVSAYVSTDRLFDAHLHISEYSRSIYGHGDRAWAHVILGGVDLERFVPPAVRRDGIAREALFVGRVLPHKGVDYLVQAASRERPVKIVGRPYDASYFEQLVGLAEGKPVTFVADCGDEELVRAYQEALCVVLPSVYEDSSGRRTAVPELLGQTLLEGMACGIPAICTRVASMPEVVVDGVTGFVVPPNDPEALAEKIGFLHDNPDVREAMGAAARRHVVESFSWERVVRRCLDAYERASRGVT